MAQLGFSATIGDRVWDCQTQFRIVAGPMDLADYQRLLPGGESLDAADGRRQELLRPGARLGPPPAPQAARNPSNSTRHARPARLDHLARQPAAATPTPATSSCGRKPPDNEREHLDYNRQHSDGGEDLQWQKSAAPPCSASSTASLTGRLRRRPCFARCGATRTWSWCTGCTRSCSSRTATCTRSSSTSASTPPGW